MDELLLSKVRLSVIGQLVNAKSVTFTELAEHVEATNGNLGAHLAKLVDAGYIKEEKRFEKRRPQSRYTLTRAGRTALLEHVAALQAIASGAAD